jgi:hypothetical protein
MDPYLESPSYCGDFLATFIPCWRRAINRALPRQYHARISVKVNWVMLEVREGKPIPDMKEFSINVTHAPTEKLVAILKLLSPWNKEADSGWMEYSTNRAMVLRQNVHLIELDLLLGGRRLQMLSPLPAGDCFALISRSDQRPKSDVYAWTLRGRLPYIPLPLLPGDPDVVVDLSTIFADTFEMGGYGDYIDYTLPPAAPIPEIHREWVAELAKSANPG